MSQEPDAQPQTQAPGEGESDLKLPPNQPSPIEQLLDPERPEKAVAAAFAGGLIFAMLLRRVRS